MLCLPPLFNQGFAHSFTFNKESEIAANIRLVTYKQIAEDKINSLIRISRILFTRTTCKYVYIGINMTLHRTTSKPSENAIACERVTVTDILLPPTI